MIFFKVFVFLLIWFVSLLGSGDIENFDDLVNFLWIWFVVLVLGVLCPMKDVVIWFCSLCKKLDIHIKAAIDKLSFNI